MGPAPVEVREAWRCPVSVEALLSDGRVRGLRARGAVTVDLAWRGGRLVTAALTSAVGGATRVRWGELEAELALEPGVRTVVRPRDLQR